MFSSIAGRRPASSVENNYIVECIRSLNHAVEKFSTDFCDDNLFILMYTVNVQIIFAKDFSELSESDTE